jgi:ketosteroid isomerase-like protein
MVAAPAVHAIEVDLFDAGHGWMDAARRGDAAALNAVLAEEFMIAVADLCGSPTNRADWITNVLTRLAIDTFQYEALRVHAYGDVALVQARYRQDGTLCGRRRAERFTVTDLWVKRDDRWQVATRYVGRVEPDCR